MSDRFSFDKRDATVVDVGLHPELEHFERLLTESRPDPSDALRERVMGDMRSQLRRQRVVRRLRFAGGMAAALLIGVGLSLATGRVTDYYAQDSQRPSVHALAAEIQKQSPELSPEEAMRRAMLVQIAAQSGQEKTVQGGMFPFSPLGPNGASLGPNGAEAKR